VAQTPAWARDLVAAVSTLAERIEAIEAAPARSSARTKSRKPTLTLAERRASDAHVCTLHDGTCGKLKDGHFATANGLAFHVERFAE
jgi:hypothetical protein